MSAASSNTATPSFFNSAKKSASFFAGYRRRLSPSQRIPLSLAIATTDNFAASFKSKSSSRIAGGFPGPTPYAGVPDSSSLC